MRFKKWLVPVVFTLTMLLTVWLALSESSPLQIGVAQSPSMRWESGWEAETPGGSSRGIALPARLTPGETAVRITLPDALPPDYCVYLKTNNQQLTATAGGQALPVEGISSVPGHFLPFDTAWSVVRLTPA